MTWVAVRAFLSSLLHDTPEWLWLTLLVIALAFTTWAYGRHQRNVYWEARVSQYETQLRLNDESYKRGLEAVRRENDRTLGELREKFAASERLREQNAPIINEVTKYVTAKSDAACRIPAGFKWVYDYTLRTELDAGLPSGGPGDVEAPTEIALSDVARTAAINNSECIQRGVVIEAWQSWYARASAAWRQLAASSVPRPELAP